MRKVKDRKRQRRESLTKGVVGKFSIAKKPSRYEIARKMETRLNQPEGKGTNRSLGSEQALLEKIENLKGGCLLTNIRKKRRMSKH
jgi:hypothetical protein